MGTKTIGPVLGGDTPDDLRHFVPFTGCNPCMVENPADPAAPAPQRGDQWPAAGMLFSQFRPTSTATRPPPHRPRRRSAEPRRHPIVGLLALIVLGLLATFFAWVSAEPLWL